MTIYRIEFAPTAARTFKKLSPEIQNRLSKTIDKLTGNPLPNGVKKLAGEDNLFRVRVGDYRIIYQLKSNELIILVVRVGHRRDIYNF